MYLTLWSELTGLLRTVCRCRRCTFVWFPYCWSETKSFDASASL